MNEKQPQRTLTDADISALASALEGAIVQRFQLNVGRGLLNILWRWALTGALLLCAYGAGGGFKKLGG